MQRHFDKLTKYLPEFTEGREYGYCPNPLVSQDEGPRTFPYMVYDDVVQGINDALWEVAEDLPGFAPYEVFDLLERNKINPTWDELTVDASQFSAELILSLLIVVYQQERFCSGFILDYYCKGIIEMWIKRLKQIDDEAMQGGVNNAQ